MNYFEELQKDVRFMEGLKACINCGTCSAICPAASFYKYDPRTIANIAQTKNNDKIEELLKSETIWYCGECMSCKTRCPRGNTPGLIIMALRYLSQKTGLFTYSEKGRQQLAIKRMIGDSILNNGYCVYAPNMLPELHPEQGPIWKWEIDNMPRVMLRLGANYQREGSGALRKIPQESLDELKSIFKETGGNDFFENIETHSQQKADEMKMDLDNTIHCEYVQHIYKQNSGNE